MIRSQPWAFLMPLPFRHKVYALKDSKSILLVGYSGAKCASLGAQIKAMGTIYPWAVSGPPREAKLSIKLPSPKPKAVWNRLLSVWKRMEAFGNDSKGMFGSVDWFFD
jgi:hypothetical protein